MIGHKASNAQQCKQQQYPVFQDKLSQAMPHRNRWMVRLQRNGKNKSNGSKRSNRSKGSNWSNGSNKSYRISLICFDRFDLYDLYDLYDLFDQYDLSDFGILLKSEIFLYLYFFLYTTALRSAGSDTPGRAVAGAFALQQRHWCDCGRGESLLCHTLQFIFGEHCG